MEGIMEALPFPPVAFTDPSGGFYGSLRRFLQFPPEVFAIPSGGFRNSLRRFFQIPPFEFDHLQFLVTRQLVDAAFIVRQDTFVSLNRTLSFCSTGHFRWTEHFRFVQRNTFISFIGFIYYWVVPHMIHSPSWIVFCWGVVEEMKRLKLFLQSVSAMCWRKDWRRIAKNNADWSQETKKPFKFSRPLHQHVWC